MLPSEVASGLFLLGDKMPQPTASDVHVNTPLTQISIAFMQEARNFIATRMFGTIKVSKQSDRYFEYLRADWNRSEARKRAPATESAGSGWNLDNTKSYFADVYAIHKDIDRQIRQNADPVINMDRDATMYVSHQLLLRMDKLWASDFFTTSVWTGSTTGGDITPGTLWDVGGSNPIDDITEQSISIQKKTGFKPNKLALGMEAYDTLRNHPDITDRIKYTQTAVVTTDILAPLFDVDEVVLARSVENTAAEGATEASDFIVSGKDALLAYDNPNPSILTPSAGYVFAWTGFDGAGPMGQRIKRFPMEPLSSDRVEGEMAVDMKVIAAELGVFFNNVVS